MGGFFDFLSAHRGGILILLLCVMAAMLLVNWVAWLFGWGRYRQPTTAQRRQHLRFIFSEATVKIINDFRHLLALLIVLIFALILGYAMIRAGGEVDKMKDALQAVVASLGGLVGSIIGYYFGESAVIKARETEPPVNDGTVGEPPPAVQGGAPPPASQPPTITPAPPPGP